MFTGSAEYNLFVPKFAPRYHEMVRLGGKAGVSLEDKHRQGVWVPRGWYETKPLTKDTWRRLTDDELSAIYGKREAP